MFSKKMITVAGAAALLFAGTAFAQTGTETAATAHETHSMPMVIEIHKGGGALLRGTVESATDSSITVNSWGGAWTIVISSDTRVLPHGVAPSAFQKGDFVGVEGTVNTSASWTIDAKLVRDWTARKAAHQEMKRNEHAVKQQIHSTRPRNFEGVASSVDTMARTFTLASEGQSYSVILTAHAQILKKNWLTLDLASVKDGDKVRVWGTAASSTISASVLRDLSTPLR